MKRINLIYTTCFILIFIISCRKEVVGPAGPSGKNGTNGISNLDVKFVTVYPSDWTYDDLYGQWYYQYKLNQSYSDSTVINCSLASNNGYQGMPFNDKLNNLNFNFSENLSKVNPYIEFQAVNIAQSDQRPLNQHIFKVMIIPIK